MKPRLLVTLLTLGLALAATGCGGGGDGQGEDNTLTFWSLEDVSDRINATQAIVDRFQQQTGIQVKLSAIAEDQFASQIQSASAAGTLPDVVGALSLGFIHSLAADDIADPDAAAAVVESLGRETFSQRALRLVEADGKSVGIPSDTSTNLLVYRKDLFEQAGLQPPDTFERIQTAASRLKQPGRAGIVAATKPADGFTQQTFEYLAVGNGCQLADDQGNVQLTSPRCVDTFRFYGDLIRNALARFILRLARGVAPTRSSLPRAAASSPPSGARTPPGSRPSSGRSPPSPSPRTATPTRPSDSSSS